MEKYASVNDSKHFFRMIIVTVFVLLLGTIGYLTIRKQFFSSTKNTNAVKPSNNAAAVTQPVERVITPFIFDPNKPWIAFSEEVQTNHPVDQPMTLIVKATSLQKDIQGFDIIFANEPRRFEIVSIENLNPAFEIFKFDKKDHITVTGLKQLSIDKPTIFTDTPLLKVTIKPKLKGKMVITFVDTANKEQTKFVDDKVEVIRPQLQPLTVEIN